MMETTEATLDTCCRGEVIVRARERRGWKQADLARELRVSRNCVSQWERGRRWPNRHHLKALRLTLDLSAKELEPEEAQTRQIGAGARGGGA